MGHHPIPRPYAVRMSLPLSFWFRRTIGISFQSYSESIPFILGVLACDIFGKSPHVPINGAPDTSCFPPCIVRGRVVVRTAACLADAAHVQSTPLIMDWHGAHCSHVPVPH